MFVGYLDYFRSCVISKLESLPENERRQSRLPSGWTPVELLKHLTYVELRWLEWGFEGRPITEPWGDTRGERWYVAEGETLDDLVAAFRVQAERSRAVIDAHDLAEAGKPGPGWDGADPATLERILFHLVQEYARHLGHLDIVAELVNGQSGSNEVQPAVQAAGAAGNSTLDGVCDLPGGLGRREVCGVDDLGLVVQPRAGCLGVEAEVVEPERRGDGVVPLDAPAEGGLVGVEDEVPDRDGMVGEARADLAPVLLDQDRHGHHQSAAGVVEYAAGGLDDERPPRRPVLEVVRLGSPGVMSMSVSPTFSASNTRESGISCCRSALVVVLPAPWVPLSHTITRPTLARRRPVATC